MKSIVHGWANKSVGMMLVRLMVGIIFFLHGIGKLGDLPGTVMFFTHIGIPGWMAYLVATVETLGGLAMIVGIFTGAAGILLVVVMVVAMATGSWARGFSAHELEFAILLSSAAIVLGGPGRYSLMEWIYERKALGQ